MKELESGVRSPLLLAVIERLERSPLLVRDADGITLAHEALLHHWGRLRKWVAAAKVDRLLAEEIERDATKWSANKDASLLWRKRRLASAEDVRRKGTVQLSDAAKRFVAAGRRDARVGKLMVAGLAAVVFGAAMYGGAAILASRKEAVAAHEEVMRLRDQIGQAEAQKALIRAQLENTKDPQKIAELEAKLAEQNQKIGNLNDQLTTKAPTRPPPSGRRCASHPATVATPGEGVQLPAGGSAVPLSVAIAAHARASLRHRPFVRARP